MEDNVNSIINKTLSIISDYYNGKESNYDKIVQIINELHNYIKTIKMSIINAQITLKISENCTNKFYPELINTTNYQNIINQIKNNIDQLKISYRCLEKYLILGEKNNQYPDLYAAYLLSINLSLLIDNIMENIKVIRLYEKSLQSGFEVNNITCNSNELNINELTNILNNTIKNVRRI